MVKMGILAFGEAGSNIAEQATSKGISSVVVNTAKLDLNKLKNIPSDCKIHLEGWEGAGRNRDEGKEAAIKYAEQIAEKAYQKLHDCDIVFVAGSCAGGTGSGGLPIGIEIVSEFKNYVGVITILPDINESLKAQMNTLECFSELSQFEQLGSIFVIDNEKIRQIYQNKTKREIYQITNSQLIDNLVEAASLTRQTSYISNFDENDLLEILNERGCCTISKVHIPADEVQTSSQLSEFIQHSWYMNCFSDSNKGQIVKSAILAKIAEHSTNLIDHEQIFSEIGMPYDIIESYYSNEGNSNHYTIYTILSGLSFPENRLSRIENIIQDAEEKLTKQIEIARTQKFQTNKWTSKFNRNKKENIQKESLKERLSKFK